jgi:hypothetical protein
MRTFNCEQYSPLWWNLRRGTPTASAFAKIITPAKGDLSKQALPYACQLVGELVDPMYGQTDDYVSAAMKNGSMMEPEVRDWYEMDTGETVQRVGFITTDDGRFGCSPDALVGADGGLECKSPTAKTQVEYLYRGELPEEYKPQVHACLVITGRKWWSFVSYFRGLPTLHIRVEPDDYTAKVREAMEGFWRVFADVRDRVPVTPIPINFPDPEEPMPSEEDMQAAMFIPKAARL